MHWHIQATKVAYDIAKIYIWKQITTPWVSQRPVQRCLWYCKDIHLEANHNLLPYHPYLHDVAYDIAKIYIWKQITTRHRRCLWRSLLLMILQRYTFGSKSQRSGYFPSVEISCLWYCKDIHLEANHNVLLCKVGRLQVAYDIAKIYIWKQITTVAIASERLIRCLWYCKDIHLEANHNGLGYRK